jgi:hypothetical protein
VLPLALLLEALDSCYCHLGSWQLMQVLHPSAGPAHAAREQSPAMHLRTRLF